MDGRIPIFFCFLILKGFAFAQQAPGVKLLAKAKDGAILLRWAPTNSETWIKGNREGYRLERFLITRKNEVNKKPEKVFLTSAPIKPKPLEQWKHEVQKNDYSAIAAQAIYGSSFQVSLSQKASFGEIVNRSKEQEQRFSFALFAADQSFQTAKLSALGFKDSTAKKDERYLYRVYVANNDSKVRLDTGLFYLGLQDTVGLVPPMQLTAQFADRLVLLRWPKSFVQQAYTSFIIERSEAGAEFKRRNSSPYLNTSNSEAETYFQVLDSLPQNGIEYQYRIRGVTPFGEIGPESERVGGKGFRTLDVRASIVQAREIKGKILIEWNLLGNKKAAIGHFVERASEDTKDKFLQLNEKPLDPETSVFNDLDPQSTNYYRIKTIGEGGQTSTSFPVLVQLADSIPPGQPQGLQVKVDTTGLAILSWLSNTEKDLLGYKIYRSNFLNSEFSEINGAAQSNNSYADRLNVKALTYKIYYKIAAFDKRMNRSAHSKVVEIKLPDIIPPLPPAIKDIRPEDNGIFIAWNPSPSDDVSSYLLERKGGDSSEWRIVKKFVVSDSNSYRDEKVNSNSFYQYRMVSIDSNKLTSVSSNVVSIRVSRNARQQMIKSLTADVDRENKIITLQWVHDQTGIMQYLIYRSEGDDAMRLYKTVPGNSRIFEDVNLKFHRKYTYTIKAVFNNGSYSKFSQQATIMF